MAEKYRYRIKSTGASSAKFGVCEVCGKPASDVFYQVEEREYTNHLNLTGWTQHKCQSYFGHEGCLLGKRR